MSATCLFFGILLYNIFGFTVQASADDKTNPGFLIKIGIGLEQLIYEEWAAETGLDSSVTTRNYTMSFEALKFWPSFFLRIDSVIPLLTEDDEERWNKYGQLYQTNKLKYEWWRVDGSAGYPMKPYFQPFLGLRWSYATQDRSNFVVRGSPISSSATETIESWHVGAGCMGDIQFDSEWGFSYVLRYFIPFFNAVKNNSVPGWEASDTSGYTAEIRANIGYYLSKHLTMALTAYGGIMHWDGSGWEPYDRGKARWPENDTEYLGGMVSVDCKF